MVFKIFVSRVKTLLWAGLIGISTVSPAFAEAGSEDGVTLRFSGATGGILRFPNTNQDKDSGNSFAEAWIKSDIELYQSNDTRFKAFVLANYVRDSKPFAYNNTQKSGVGLSLSTRVGKHLELTFSARYDWFRELETTTEREGMRYAIDYYYYRYWPDQEGKSLWGMEKRANVFKSYGTLEYKGSLIKGDDNVVLTVGGEYSTDYAFDDSKWLFVPFVDMHFSWDVDQNNYNNKIIPAVGAKLRRPVEKGEIFVGVKLEADYRWVDGTLDTGPMVFAGWYKGF